MSARRSPARNRRSHTRALVMQAHYQQQLDGTSRGELQRQFETRDEYARVDADYFATLLKESMRDLAPLDAEIASHADRSFDQLDPVEVAILRVALTELRHHVEVPYRVVINEAVELAHRFGAEDGHKYVNAIVDRAAAVHRAAERASRRQSG